ncbi:MAG: FAD-dependent oxidoreductase [Desulfobacterales bacterium]|nr:FAD-dependent oxidoreductase [Desulfobacterales bacterium]
MRIAVIGTGIAGMVAAYLLSDEHELVVYEAEDYVGGHTNTIDVSRNGASYAVDTGFIVFNEKTYPNFVKLMKRLGVAWKPSNMSFSVQCKKTGLEFSPSSFNSLFIQRKNLLRPAFYRMVLDIFRFRRESEELLKGDDYTLTLKNFLAEKGFSKLFIEHFIMPMGGAIWSADPVKFNEFPALYFAQFFKNHGFLNIRNQPQWQVIAGGSRQYVKPITAGYRDQIRLNCPVKSIQRHPDHVEIQAENSPTERFDQVVIAAHSDQALAMLQDPSDSEKEILGVIPYQDNHAVLHSDESILPSKKAAWASWNYHIPQTELGRVALTYDMNILQSLNAPVEYCVTLNLPHTVDSAEKIKEMHYHHPVYNPKSLAARNRHQEINGVNRTYFCGAYWGYGFHEDGVKSALVVGKHFGKSL